MRSSTRPSTSCKAQRPQRKLVATRHPGGRRRPSPSEGLRGRGMAQHLTARGRFASEKDTFAYVCTNAVPLHPPSPSCLMPLPGAQWQLRAGRWRLAQADLEMFNLCIFVWREKHRKVLSRSETSFGSQCGSCSAGPWLKARASAHFGL